jgi:hypothetical protein
LDFGFWDFSSNAATVTGNLTDISIAPLTTKMLFTPTTNVLVTGSGLSAGPPKMITTSGGAFALDLEAGDYTVSLPLITYRAPFRISVFATNGTVNNITNLLSPAEHTHIYQLARHRSPPRKHIPRHRLVHERPSNTPRFRLHTSGGRTRCR